MINFYKSVKTKKFHNPEFSKHVIIVPARILVCGGSGSGKTNFSLNILKIMKNTFSHVIVCCKTKHGPLYEMLEAKLKENVTFYEDGEVPDIKDFEDNQEQILIIFDDLVNADKKVQQKICEFFLRGMKLNITSLYLSQSYFKTPKFIRINCGYIFLRGISSKQDLSMILREYKLGVDIKKLMQIYKFAVAQPFSFLVIDVDAPEERKFRSNFKVIPNECEN